MTSRSGWGSVKQQRSGRYQASYSGPDGERHIAPMTFDTKTDARGWLSIARSQILQGTWRTPAAIASVRQTIGSYAERWIAERPLRDRTRVEYQRLMAGPIQALAAVPLNALTTPQVRTWHHKLTEAGTVTTAARAYGLLRSIMATATADGLIPANPVTIKGAQNRTTGRKVTPPTPAELQKILDTITPKYRAAVIIAAWGGLRYGELTELRRKDITITGETILVSVSRAVTHTTGLGFQVGKTKSEAGVRGVILPPHVNDIVIHHLAEYTGAFPNSLLFPASDGSGHLGQSTFAKHWYPARDAAGRPDLPWHGLRHFGATRYALTGATLKELQTRLGHSTVAAALKYQHGAGRDAELAAKMSQLANET
jgi:integrase